MRRLRIGIPSSSEYTANVSSIALSSVNCRITS